MTGPDGVLAGVLLGLLQGVAEWFPISSEGVTAAAYSFAFGREFDEAVSFALWLHLGTTVSALVAFRQEFLDVLRDVVARPTAPSPPTRFLVVATVVSAPLGFVLLLGLSGISNRIGAGAMLVVGVLLLATAVLLIRARAAGERTRQDLRGRDAVLTGIAQGLAALPGLSRSGLTVSALVGRRVDRREALAMSFVLSVPASLGAGLYAGFKGGFALSPTAGLALLVAAVVGVVTIRALLALAQRINFAGFVLAVAVLVLAGAAWELVG